MSELARTGGIVAMRNHPAYWAFVLHRVSGVALTLFLPIHFCVVALMLDPTRSDAFFRWTERPFVKLAETVLVVLLAVHMAGGLRLLALEFLPWRDVEKNRITIAFGFAVASGLLFLLAAW